MRPKASSMTAAQLRDWRKARKWTQVRLAEIFGVSLRTVVYYESGEVRIPLVVEKLVNAIGAAERARSSMTGAQLRALRRAQDLTQAQMADALGCSLGTVRRYEAGTRRAPLFLEKLLKTGAWQSSLRPTVSV